MWFWLLDLYLVVGQILQLFCKEGILFIKQDFANQLQILTFTELNFSESW